MMMLLLCCCCSSSAFTIDSAVQYYSFALCVTDAPCAYRLRSLVQTTPNTDEEYLAFSEVFVQALTPNRPLIETILPDVDACVANETIDGCTVVLRLWLGVLRSMNPCADDNSVWRIGEGCVCAHGRHCADDEVPIKISDLWSYEVAIAIAVVCVLIRGVISYKEVTHLHREQQKLENDHVSVLKKNAQAQTSQQQQPKKRQILGMTGA